MRLYQNKHTIILQDLINENVKLKNELRSIHSYLFNLNEKANSIMKIFEHNKNNESNTCNVNKLSNFETCEKELDLKVR